MTSMRVTRSAPTFVCTAVLFMDRSQWVNVTIMDDDEAGLEVVEFVPEVTGLADCMRYCRGLDFAATIIALVQTNFFHARKAVPCVCAVRRVCGAKLPVRRRKRHAAASAAWTVLSILLQRTCADADRERCSAVGAARPRGWVPWNGNSVCHQEQGKYECR